MLGRLARGRMPNHGKVAGWRAGALPRQGAAAANGHRDGAAASSDSGPDGSAGERVRSARRARGLTQDQFAQAMGVSRSAVAQWETGRSGFLGKLRRISEVLDIPMRQLQPGGAARSFAAQPDHAPISAEEITLLRHFRKLDLDDQECLLRVARKLAVA